MGRQINYYLELDGLLSLSERALSLGCQIVREDLRAGAHLHPQGVHLTPTVFTYTNTKSIFFIYNNDLYSS